MLGELHKQGWKPKRTIIYCAWDGEEPGLAGFDRMGRNSRDELQKHAVAYINSDSNGRGFFRAGGSHDLEKFINDVMRDVEDPRNTYPSGNERDLSSIANAKNPEERAEIRKRTDLAIGALGDGSDYAVFPRPCRHLRSEHRLSAARTTPMPITPSTTISTGTRTSSTPISPTDALWRKPAAPP